MRSLVDGLDLDEHVTLLVGDNGSGKSTLAEALAVALGFNAEGGSRNFAFATRDSTSPLHEYLQLVRSVQRPSTGFFLRAESFYNVATQVEDLGIARVSYDQVETVQLYRSFLASPDKVLHHLLTQD